jgi:hypothetical protein
MNLTDALDWANTHNAVIRFNNNENDGDRSVRCTVVGHKPEDRIIAIQKTPEGADIGSVLASTISEVRTEFEATDKRSHLRAV